MSEGLARGDDARRASAADWLVRLQTPDFPEAEAVAFDGWLAADSANARAYDATLGVMLELQSAARDIAEELAVLPRSRARSNRRGWLAAAGLAAAAAVALVVVPFSAIGPAATTAFATAKGEHRNVRLADGSSVDLNAGTRLSVTLGRHDRRVVMPQGEAIFDVAADPARPFLIAVGDRTVRVVGTRFNVRHRGDQLAVTVERGIVEVRPNDGVAGRSFRLHPGQRLDTAQGATAVALSVVDPQQVESWRTGRLIYRDQPLRDVIVDLNQEFARPIILETASLAETRVSGVLVLDDQDAVIRRLALLAPIKATASGSTVRLSSDPAVKP